MSARSLQAWEIAAESYDLAVGPRVRPTVWEWLRYVYWRRLPRRNAVWVLYDTTCSTWVARHVARVLISIVPPVLLILLVLPGPAPLRELTAFVAGACAALFTTMYINEATEHRLRQAGYAWRLGSLVRAKRDEVAQFRHNW